MFFCCCFCLLVDGPITGENYKQQFTVSREGKAFILSLPYIDFTPSPLACLSVACSRPRVDCLQSAFLLKSVQFFSLIQRDCKPGKLNYALISRGSRLYSPLACLGFACSNLAKKNKRLLAVQAPRQSGPMQRKHENKTGGNFSPPRQLFAYLFLSCLPLYLRAWNRLAYQALGSNGHNPFFPAPITSKRLLRRLQASIKSSQTLFRQGGWMLQANRHINAHKFYFFIRTVMMMMMMIPLLKCQNCNSGVGH